MSHACERWPIPGICQEANASRGRSQTISGRSRGSWVEIYEDHWVRNRVVSSCWDWLPDLSQSTPRGPVAERTEA